LRRAAADFEDAIGRSEALSFAALVAVADGEIGAAELGALAELGQHLELDAAQVDSAVEGVVRDLEQKLEN
jgi:tellurite resistance protein